MTCLNNFDSGIIKMKILFNKILAHISWDRDQSAFDQNFYFPRNLKKKLNETHFQLKI